MTARMRLNVTVINTLPVLLDCVRVLFHSALGESIVVSLSNLILDLRGDSDEYLFVYLRAITVSQLCLWSVHIYLVSNLTKCTLFRP
jgi:hypothetical protein